MLFSGILSIKFTCFDKSYLSFCCSPLVQAIFDAPDSTAFFNAIFKPNFAQSFVFVTNGALFIEAIFILFSNSANSFVILSYSFLSNVNSEFLIANMYSESSNSLSLLRLSICFEYIPFSSSSLTDSLFKFLISSSSCFNLLL
jgi:hypothetical protein